MGLISLFKGLGGKREIVLTQIVRQKVEFLAGSNRLAKPMKSKLVLSDHHPRPSKPLSCLIKFFIFLIYVYKLSPLCSNLLSINIYKKK